MGKEFAGRDEPNAHVGYQKTNPKNFLRRHAVFYQHFRRYKSQSPHAYRKDGNDVPTIILHFICLFSVRKGRQKLNPCRRPGNEIRISAGQAAANAVQPIVDRSVFFNGPRYNSENKPLTLRRLRARWAVRSIVGKTAFSTTYYNRYHHGI